MGFNGEVIVVRSQASPEDLGRFIGTVGHDVRFDWALSGGWRAIHVRAWAEPYSYDHEWLAEVSATSGAPVLACWVFESDVAHIRGLSSAGAWDCWLNLPYAAGMLAEQAVDEAAPALNDEGAPDVSGHHHAERLAEESARLTREIPLAARRAAAWAAQAGYPVRAEPIEELLRAPRELFIQWGFFKLLYRLGLTDTEFDPDAED